MDVRKALDARAVGLMVVLCLIWALQQIVLKATAPDIAPIMQIGLRSGASALLVALLMLARGERMTPGTGAAGALVGVLFALEFLFVGEGLRHTSAAHTVVFLYTAPLFAALGLHLRLPSERLHGPQWLGIVLAFAGLAYSFVGHTGANAASGSTLWGDFLVLLGGLGWGLTTVVVRCSRLSNVPATQTLLYQLLGACVVLVPVAFASGQAAIHFTPVVWASLVFHAVVVSFASYLAWFWLLRHYLASRLGVFSFLTPLLGILLGGWLLGEPLEARFLLGALLVLAGIVLVSGYGALVQWLRRRPQVAGS